MSICCKKSEKNDRIIYKETHRDSKLNGFIIYDCRSIKPSELPKHEYQRRVSAYWKKKAKVLVANSINNAARNSALVKVMHNGELPNIGQWLDSKESATMYFEAFGLQLPESIKTVIESHDITYPNDLKFDS